MVNRKPVPVVHEAGTTFRAALEPIEAMAPDWDATLYLRGPDVIDIAGDHVGIGHEFVVEGAGTAGWSPGEYSWTIRAARGADVVTIQSGMLSVTPDPVAVTAGADARTHAVKVLQAVEAVLEGSATLEQKSYTIGDRSLERRSLKELRELRSQYRQYVAQEKACREGRRTMGRRHLVRFL